MSKLVEASSGFDLRFRICESRIAIRKSFGLFKPHRGTEFRRGIMQNFLSSEKRSQPPAGGALTIQYHCHSERNRPKGGGGEESRYQIAGSNHLREPRFCFSLSFAEFFADYRGGITNTELRMSKLVEASSGLDLRFRICELRIAIRKSFGLFKPQRGTEFRRGIMKIFLSIRKRSQPPAGGALTIQYHCHSERNRPKGGGDEESRYQVAGSNHLREPRFCFSLSCAEFFAEFRGGIINIEHGITNVEVEKSSTFYIQHSRFVIRYSSPSSGL
jgi:hypothetical protein